MKLARLVAVPLLVVAGCGGGGSVASAPVSPGAPSPNAPNASSAPSASSAPVASAAAAEAPKATYVSPCPARAGSESPSSTARQILSGRHSQSVVSLAFSPNGRYLASAANDGSIRVWDVTSRDVLRVVRRVGQFSSIGWSDETHFAFGSLGPDPLLYDVVSGTPRPAFESVGFTRALASAPAGSGAAWIKLAFRTVTLLGPDAQKLQSFELTAGQKLGNAELALSLDHATVAAPHSADAIVVRGLGASDKERVVRLTGAEQVGEIGLLPNGSRAVVEYKKAGWSYLGLVETRAGARLESLPWPAELGLSNGGGPPVSDLAASARFAAAATTQGFFVWDLGQKKLAWSHAVPPELGVKTGDLDFVERVTFSPNGALLAFGTRAGRVFLYDAASGRLQGELGSKINWPNGVAFLAPDRLALLSTDTDTKLSDVSVWSLAEARVVSSQSLQHVEAIAAQAGSVVTLAATPDTSCAAGFVRKLGNGGGANGICTKDATSFDPWLQKTELDARSGSALVPIGINPRGVLNLKSGRVTALEGSETPQLLLQSARLSPDGGWVVGYDTDTALVWNARTGKLVRKLPLAKHVPNASTPTALAISADSRVFALAIPQFLTPNVIVQSFELATGKPLAQAPLSGGVVSALAFGESSDVLAVGGIGGARGSFLVLRNGQVAASSSADADWPWQVAVDPSHAIAATLSQDGGVRIWDMKTAALRATLASFVDGEWLAATPGGAYDGTLEVAPRIGWVFEQPPERFAFAQFSSTFRDPALVRRRLNGEAADVAVKVQRPPSISVVSAPPLGRPVEQPSAKLVLHAASADRVDVVRVFADGRPIAERAVCAAEGDASVDVPLLRGVNRVTAVAYDARGFASNEATIDIEATRPDAVRPDAWVVAIGVGKYRSLPASAQLGAAVNDARGIADLFQAMAGSAFAHVNVKPLYDDLATPASIRDAIAWLGQMKPTDVAVVFFAGHGVKPEQSRDMVLVTGGIALSADGKHLDPASLKSDALGFGDVADAIAKLKGRVLVLLDACHSGHFSQELLAENDLLARSLVNEQRAGAVVFAASKGRQVSFEPASARGLALDTTESAEVKLSDTTPHGFFTGAFLTAMSDPVTDRNGDGAVALSELVDEVSRRVSAASNGAQTPWIARREMIGDFTLAPAAKR